MKNITVSLDDELYRKSRIAAAEADTSVTAMVREFLTILTGSDLQDGKQPDATTKVLAVIEKMRQRHPGFNPANPFTREEVHSR